MDKSTDLKSQLEEVYNKAKVAIAQQDQTAFEALVEPAKPGANIPPEHWQEAAKQLSGMYVDLKDTHYLAAEQKGDYAYYFMQDFLNDEHYIDIAVLKFHSTPNGWKLSGSSAGSSFPKAETEQVNQSNIAKELEKLKNKLDN